MPSSLSSRQPCMPKVQQAKVNGKTSKIVHTHTDPTTKQTPNLLTLPEKELLVFLGQKIAKSSGVETEDGRVTPPPPVEIAKEPISSTSLPRIDTARFAQRQVRPTYFKPAVNAKSPTDITSPRFGLGKK